MSSVTHEQFIDHLNRASVIVVASWPTWKAEVLDDRGPAVTSEVDALQAKLDACEAEAAAMRERMDQARKILTDGKPTCHCNWGILDTSDINTAGRELLAELKRKGERIKELEAKLAESDDLLAAAREIVDAISDGGFLTGESNSPKVGDHQVVVKFRDIQKMQRLYSALIALGIKLRDAKGGAACSA